MAEYRLDAEITPKLAQGFKQKVEREVKAALARVKAEVPVKAKIDAKGLQAELNRAARATKASVKVKAELDSRGLQQELNRAARAAGASVKVKANLDGRSLQQELNRAIRERKVNIKAEIDTIRVQRQLEGLMRDRAIRLRAEIDVDRASEELYRLRKSNENLEQRLIINDQLAKVRLATMQKRYEKLETEWKVDTKKANADISALADRAERKFQSLKLATAFTALPALAAVGAAGAVAAIGTVPLAFAGAAIAAQKSNQQVSDAYSDLSAHVIGETRRMSAPMAQTFIDIAAQARGAFDDLRPQLTDTFRLGREPLLQLTGSVEHFAERSLPGMNVALRNSREPLAGFDALLTHLGQGLTEMFVNLEVGSAGMRDTLSITGGVLQDFLGFLGSLVSNLSTGAVPVLGQFRGAMHQLEGVILNLTSSSGGMPALAGAASGFIGTVGGALGVLNAFVGVLGGWAGPVGNVIGSLTAMRTILRLLPGDLGNSFSLNPLKAFAQGVDEFGRTTLSPFRQALIEADQNGTSKFKAGLSSVVSGGINPMGFALVGAGLLLDLFGKQQQQAAAKVAAHRDRVSSLAAALRDSSGALDENVRKTAAMALQDFDAGDGKRNLLRDVENLAGPRGIQLLTDSYLGNSDAQRELLGVLGGVVDEHTKASASTSTYGAATGKLKTEVDATGQSAQQLIDIVSGTSGTFKDAVEENRQLQVAMERAADASRTMSDGMRAAGVASANLKGEFQSLNDAGGGVEEKGEAIIGILDDLGNRGLRVEDAMQGFNDTLRDFGKEAEGFSPKMLQANGAIDTTAESGSKLQDVVQKASINMAAYAQAMRDSGQPTDAIRAKMGELRGEVYEQLRALGLTDQQVNTLLDHYGLVPDEIVTAIRITGDTVAQKAIDDVIQKLFQVPPNTPVTVSVPPPAQEAFRRTMEEFGYTVRNLPNGQIEVTADPSKFNTQVNETIVATNQKQATVTVFGNANPAMDEVKNWQGVTTRTAATTTTYTYTDPATGAVTSWVFDTNTKKAITTTYTNTNPATGERESWIRDTNGKWTRINVGADTGQAQRDIDSFIITNTGRRIDVTINPVTGAITGRSDLQGIAATKATGGWIYGPGTSTSDSIPARLSDGEFVVRASQAQKHPQLLEAINSGTRGFATGGWVGFAEGGAVDAGSSATAGLSAQMVLPSFDPAIAGAEAYNTALLALVTTINTTLNPAVAALQGSLGTMSAAQGLFAAQMLQSWQALGVDILGTWNATGAALNGSWLTTTNQLAATTLNNHNTLKMSTLDWANFSTLQWQTITTQTWANVNQQNIALGALRDGLRLTRDAIGETANWAVTQYARIWHEGAAPPIRTTLNLGINQGLIAAWNNLNGQFNFGKVVPPVAIPFATGGRVPGMGNKDSVPAMLMPGEYVLSKLAIKRMGGLGAVDAAHQAARRGDPARAEERAHFAVGGPVGHPGFGLPFAYGGVAPHVEAAGKEMERLFGPYPGGIGGRGSRGNTSDHPFGFALDLMTLNNSQLGDRSASHLQANAERMNVKYIIWKQAINQGKGWRPMENRGSATANHFDHVHVSFEGGPLGGKWGEGPEGGAGFFFDPQQIVNDAFAGALGNINGIGPVGNIAAEAGKAMALQMLDKVKAFAVDKLSTAVAGAVAGSPEVVAAVRAVASQFGWGSGPEWDALNWIISKESGWNPNAANPKSSARGLFQKMTSLHGPLEPTVAGQAQWGLNYIRGSYGTPSRAKAFHMSHGWYANGGWVLGPGTHESDSVLAHLSNGEFVVRARAAQANRGLLEAINKGEVESDRYGRSVKDGRFTKDTEIRNIMLTVGGFGTYDDKGNPTGRERSQGGWTTVGADNKSTGLFLMDVITQRPGPLRHGTVSQALWDQLLKAGWYGDPTDRMEALYPPRNASLRDILSVVGDYALRRADVLRYQYRTAKDRRQAASNLQVNLGTLYAEIDAMLRGYLGSWVGDRPMSPVHTARLKELQALTGGSTNPTDWLFDQMKIMHGEQLKPIKFDSGGSLKPGVQLVANKTRKPETVTTDEQFAKMGVELKQAGKTIHIDQVVFNVKTEGPLTEKDLRSMWSKIENFDMADL